MTDVPYIPHGWVLGKFKDDLKVFCSWSGGYTHGESWRLNSKVRTVEVDEDHYVINKGGSEYHLGLWNYGRINAYNAQTLYSLEDKGFEILDEEDAIEKLDLIFMLSRAQPLVEDIDVDLDEPLDPNND